MQTAYRDIGYARWRAALCVLAIGVMIQMTGCISAPPPKPNLIEQARHENAIGTDLARQFEAKLHFHSDAEVNRYLDRIAAALAAPGKDPRLTGAHVSVISDTGGRWRSFGLPGRRIYFPLGLLRELRFDNEVAAVIALEDGNILKAHVIDHLNHQLALRERKKKKAELTEVGDDVRVPDSVDFLSSNGIFSLEPDDVKESIRVAIPLMYSAGFDSRGLIEIWERFAENPAHSPYSPEVLSELLDFTRETISLYAPLRDPVVGTAGFESIHKRIEKL